MRSLHLVAEDSARLEEVRLTDRGRLGHVLNPGVCPQYLSVHFEGLGQLKRLPLEESRSTGPCQLVG